MLFRLSPYEPSSYQGDLKSACMCFGVEDKKSKRRNSGGDSEEGGGEDIAKGSRLARHIGDPMYESLFPGQYAELNINN